MNNITSISLKNKEINEINERDTLLLYISKNITLTTSEYERMFIKDEDIPNRTNKHFREADRTLLEKLFKLKLTNEQLSLIMCKSVRSIQRERKRGATLNHDTHLKEVYVYRAATSESEYIKARRRTGTQIVMTVAKQKYLDKIMNYVRTLNSSLQVACNEVKESIKNKHEELKDETVSFQQLYTYASYGLIKYTPKKYRSKKVQQRKGLNRIIYPSRAHRMIDFRPKKFDITPLHWQMDTVESSRDGSSSLLVLTEIQSRFELVFKLSSSTTSEVVRVFDMLERYLHDEYNLKFNDIFKSILTDNGSYFIDFDTLEKSIFKRRKRKRTIIYFCHAYRSQQKAIVERNNGIIRVTFPKKTNFDLVTEKELGDLQFRMNIVPRPTMGFMVPEKKFMSFIKAKYEYDFIDLNFNLTKEQYDEWKIIVESL